MISFLKQITQKIELNRLGKSLFIFPTQRAVSLFKNELFNGNKNAMELPVIVTWSDFIENSHTRKTIDKKSGLLYLYQAYVSKNSNPGSFSQFLNWGDIIYDDFEQIILQNIDAETILNQVNLIKTFEKWDLELTSKKKYLEIWNILPILFQDFQDILDQQNLCTSASKYLLAQRYLDNEGLKNEICYFCGFTVFSEAEKNLISIIKKYNKVVFVHDNPIWGSVNKSHESNRFEKENRELFTDVISVDEETKVSRKMTGLNCANDVLASKTVSELLQDISEDDYHNTAVVLLNDADLPLLLNSIPKSVKEINIGKGKAFLNTQEGLLFQALISLDKSLKRKKEVSFVEIFELLDLLKPFNILKLSEIEVLRDGILHKNLKSLNRKQFSGIFSGSKMSSLHALYQNETSLSDFIENIINAQEFDWSLASLIYNNTLLKLELFSKSLITDEVISYFLENEIRTTTLPIQGERKRGLQILSLLETRCLDFKNLIFLSFSDENLPQSSISTYIPLELRVQYNLPDKGAHESVFAYHFMRLLKRAKEVSFVYSENSSFSKSGDPSRFLLQAAMEWQKKDDKLEFENQVVKNELTPFVKNELTIEKSDEVYGAIKHYLFGRGLSPSALNVYLSNPMDFLLYHVLGLREKENVDLAVETSSLGTVIHDTLEEMYKPYLHLNSDSIKVSEILKKVPGQLELELSKVYPKSYLESGRLNILLPVLKKWILNFLNIDKKRGVKSPFTLIELEQQLKYTFPEVDFPLKMKGVVDRLENWKGCEHIIDYKTGKVDQKDLKLTTQELLELNPDKSKAYQLLMYTLIYRGVKTGPDSLLSSIYSFRNQKSGYLPLLINGNEKIGESELQDFRQGIIKVSKSMLNRDVPIELTNHRYQKFSV